MNRFLYLMLSAMVLSSCADELWMTGYCSMLPDEIRATICETSTRTSMDEFGNIRWMEGDEISFFLRKTINSRYVLKNGAGSTAASFKLIPPTEPVAGSDIPYNVAYYPYQEEIELERNATSAILTVSLPDNQCYAESSPGNGANPMVAVTENVEDLELAFKNINSMVKLQLTGDVTVSKIEFSGNNDEVICGSARVTASHGTSPAITMTGDGKVLTLDCESGVRLNPSTATPFYISLPPITLSKGFTLKIYDTVGRYMEKSSSKSITLGRSRIKPFSAFNYEATGEVEGNEGSGIYLGIVGFNQDLSNYPIKLLTTNSRQGYFDFIDGLSNGYEGTAIYYAVDQAISTLQSKNFPSDLNSVNVITFTDGIDNYSLDIYDEIEFGRYNSPDECGDYVKSRITNEQVSGNGITGYAVGSKHSNVNSIRFTSTLNRIASSSSLVFEIDDMSAVENKFKEIAKNITEINKTQNIIVSIASGGLATGDRIRFTFDLESYATTPEGSSLFIEGTFQRTSATTRKITNITCCGLTLKGTEVVGTKNLATGLFDFIFEDVASNDKVLINEKKTLEWWGDPWQMDEEFTPDENTQTEILTHSAAIILVLDCTKSLGDKFIEMKNSAKSFINTMLPNIVPAQTSLSFKSRGETKTVTVSSDCDWTATSSESWLTVNRSGNSLLVSSSANSSVSPRTATITLCNSGSYASVATISVAQAGDNSDLSTTPKDLSLAVVKNGIRYYASQEEYDEFVRDNSSYLVEGVCVIAGTESFIVDLKDVSYYEMRRPAAKLMFPGNIPSYSQGIVISSRFEEINTAISAFGGETLTNGCRYHTSYNSGDTYYFIRGLGGKLDNGCTSLMPGYLRCVRSTDSSPKVATNDLKLKISRGSEYSYLTREEFLSNGIPAGFSVVGVAIYTPGAPEIAVELTDKTQNAILRSAAKQLYADFVPTYNEGIIISARMYEINDAISAFGGTPMDYSYHYHTTAYSGSNYYFINGYGGYLDDGHTSLQEGYVRGVVR